MFFGTSTRKEKCKVCGMDVVLDAAAKGMPLLEGGKDPSPLIRGLVEWTKEYDGCRQIMLSPHKRGSIGTALPPMVVRTTATDLIRVGFFDPLRPMLSNQKNCLYTSDFCTSDCLRAYSGKFEEFTRISTVWVPSLTKDEVERYVTSHSEADGDVMAGVYEMVPFDPVADIASTDNKGTAISLDHMFSTVYDSLDVLYAAGGLGPLPGFSLFKERKEYISLKALDKMLGLIATMERRFPSCVCPRQFTEQKKIMVLKWILNDFGYNVERCSKRKTVLAAVEKHELSVISYGPPT